MILPITVLSVVGFLALVTGSMYDGLPSMAGFVIIPPFMAAFTLLGVVIAGLPLRLFGPLRRWWKGHVFVMPIIAASGTLL
jgi:hypothetical protein